MSRPCIICGTPTRNTRCPAHRIPRPSRADKTRRRQAVHNHIATHGHMCPGYKTPPHPATDLTADHLHPRSAFGEHGPLGVLCRACNTRRHNLQAGP